MIKRLIQGAVIGLANIIPGVSGGTMMVVMGIYDKVISAVTHLRKEYKKSLAYLWPIFLGAVISLLVFAKLIELSFQRFPIPTNLLFCGLIAGSLPIMFKEVRGKRMTLGMGIGFFFFFGLVLGVTILGGRAGTPVELTFDVMNGLKLFAVGMIAAATMVIPGVSGSMVLTILGYYTTILEGINGFVKATLGFQISVMIKYGLSLLPFGLGILFGIVLIAKLVEWMFRRARVYAYWCIIGLIVASPVAILWKMDWTKVTLINMGIGLGCFCIGWLISSRLSE